MVMYLVAVVESPSNLAQWIGLVATLVGTGVGVFGLICAWLAARRAKGAREAAEMAERAATRAGRIARLADLIDDMQELQVLLAEGNFSAIARKANLLRGRVVRFKREAYTELSNEEQQDLDSSREQLSIVAKVALGEAKEQNKAKRIQLAYGIANESLNRVFAMHGQRPGGN